MSNDVQDVNQLPFLLRLLDDQSPNVRQKVAATLRAYGPEVDEEIERQGLQLTAEQHAALQAILQVDFDLPKAWRAWQRLPGETQRLEAALAALAEWQLGSRYPARLGELLDSLTMEFISRGQMPDYVELSHFLFEEKGLRGDAEDYYNPHNSNLVKVIEEKRGLPISLACIFILVGKRLDLVVHGCNFPGHFLARVRDGDEDLVFDCFNGGRLLAPAEVVALRKAAPAELDTPASTATIITRTLHNLISAYHQAGEADSERIVFDLLSRTL